MDIIDCFVPEGTPGFADGDVFTIVGMRGKYRAHVCPLRTREPCTIVPPLGRDEHDLMEEVT